MSIHLVLFFPLLLWSYVLSANHTYIRLDGFAPPYFVWKYNATTVDRHQDCLLYLHGLLQKDGGFPYVGISYQDGVCSLYYVECFLTDYQGARTVYIPYINCLIRQHNELYCLCYESLFAKTDSLKETWTSDEGSLGSVMLTRTAPTSDDYTENLLKYLSYISKRDHYIWTAYGNVKGSKLTRLPTSYMNWESGNSTEVLQEGHCVAMDTNTGLWKQMNCSTQLAYLTVFTFECKSCPQTEYRGPSTAL
uniref:C-type lectin domain-containing protein n=1 Tax=Steinernema glaseri TaxID=37863 RepID=A0A1I7Y0I3_9BILA